MIRTVDIETVEMDDPTNAFIGGKDILIIAAGQVVGGAYVAGLRLIEAWKVSDLQVDHWYKWLRCARPGVADSPTAIAVDPGVSGSVRRTIDRFSACGVQEVAAERHRREGVLDVVRELAQKT